VGLVLWNMGRVALGTLHRKTGYGDCLAPQGTPPVVGKEGPARATRTPCLPGIRKLIRKMSRDNPIWGAPRIHGELLKLGIDIGETSVSKYMVRLRNPPSQTWRTFLENHLKSTVSIDFFTVPTIRFQVLYVFLVRAHDRRRIVH
jgi:putative transposase